VPFGAYLLLKRLAVGGMAELFLARDTRSGKLVVLKRILPYLAEEAEFVRMFLDEARIAAALHHPSIVELYELGHLEGATFISMEWVDGIDLRKVLQKEQERGGVVPPGIAAWLAARLCEGLQHAHSARDTDGRPLGIIHRDVSPQNVMVSFDGDVKLVDFGIAKATAWMSRSKPGVIKGKFLYLAPEQLTTEPLDHRADLFALGTLLYELTTGRSPFYRTSTEAVIYSIRMEDPAPPSTVRRGYPEALWEIISHCLEKDRERRYQSAAQIAEALEDFIRSEAPTSRTDVVQYIARLFGNSEERTSIYIPPNAQAPQAPPEPNTAPQPRGPFDEISEERTVPLPPVSTKETKVSRQRVPEGRRQTSEIDASPTGPTSPERPSVRAQKGNPWEPEVTAPMTDKLPRPGPRVPEAGVPRDFQRTAELDDAALGEDTLGPTTVSTSGARDVKVGEVFKPLVPTLHGESDAALRPLPKVVPPPRPGPPLSSDTSAPQLDDVSVVSAGEATIGASPVGEPERSAPSEPSEPVPPPSTRAPPRRSGAPARPAVRKRPPPGFDPDDEIETIDQQHEYSKRSSTRNRRMLVALVALSAVLLAVLLAIVLWPGGKAEPLRPPPPEPTEPRAGAELPVPPPTSPTPRLARVEIKAVKGTLLSIDGQPVEPGATIERAPGELQVKFTCPGKKKRAQSMRATIPDSDALFLVNVPCN
jgi:serine/threonine protein kinase